MRRLLFGLVFLAGAATLSAQEPHHHEGGGHAHGKLGTVIFPNSGAAAAQTPFLHGTALLHSFEYEMAREAFGEAQAADRSFALAYWMEALANRSTLWGIERLDSARAILERLGATREARLARAKTPRERAYGAAIEALFADAPELERVRGFADSMRAVMTKYPDDMEAHAFTSLALLSVSVLTPDSLDKPIVNEAIEHAKLVYAKNADHPGALHYLIHSYDHPERAPQGLEVARAYAKTAPASEHALHMPSHIFVQVGLWDDVIASNEAAWAASRAEVMRRKASPSENDFHSLAWLQYAYLQQGRNADARALIDTARVVLSGIDMTTADYIDARYVVSDLEFAYANETGDWSAAPTGMAAPGAIGASPRAQNFAARDRYARAFSAVMRGDTATALAIMPQLRGRAQLQVQAMLAQARSNTGQQILLLEQAVAIEDTQTPFGPSYGPPSLELLGDALLKAGRAGEAKAMYERSLERRPNRRIALDGLKRAQGMAAGAAGK